MNKIYYVISCIVVLLVASCHSSWDSPFQIRPNLPAYLIDPMNAEVRPVLQPERTLAWGSANHRNRSYDTGVIQTAVRIDDVARAAVFQTDGKLVVAGRTFNGTYNHFIIARYWPDGSLDRSFNSDGIYTRQVDGGFAWAHSVAIDSNGRIIAAGRTYNVSYNWAIVRVHGDGSTDTTFASDGVVTLDFNEGPDFAREVRVQADDKIIVGGYAYNGSNYDFAVTKLLTNGTVDSVFGQVLTPFGTGDDVALGMTVVSSNEEIVLVGYTQAGANEEMAIAVYSTDGTLDTNFSTDGMDTLAAGSGDSRAYAVDVRPVNEHYLVSGRSHNGSNHDFHVVRWNDANGSLVWNFPITVAANADIGHSILVETNINRNLLVGRTFNGSNWDFGTMRVIHGSGGLDTDWDGDGKQATAIGTGDEDAFGIAYSGTNRLIVVGRTHNGSNFDFAIARYNSDGALAQSGDHDEYFSVDGEDATNLGSTDFGYDIVVLSDGRYVIGGYTEQGGPDNSNRDFGIVRYTTNGIEDATFHTDGIATMALGAGGRDEAYAIVVQTDGKIVIGGFAENTDADAGSRDFAIARFGLDGERDTTFHQDGTFVYDFDSDREQVNDLAIQSDGKILASGFGRTGSANTSDFFVVRLLTTGMTDAAFHTDGIHTVDINSLQDEGRNMLIQPSDQRIVVGGFAEMADANSGRDFALIRLMTDGARDTTFGSDGIVTQNFNSDLDEIYDIAIQSDGKIYAVGVSYHGALNTSGDFAIMRLLTTGSVDTTWNSTGLRTDDFSSNFDVARCVIVTANGKILVAGSQEDAAANGADHAILRYNTDGSIDTTFDGDGKIVFATATGDDYPDECEELENDGRIILGGRDGGNYGIVRIWP